MKMHGVTTWLMMAILAASLVLISGCGEEDKDEPTNNTDTSEEAPQLPPETSMVMDFSSFTGTSNRTILKSVDLNSDPFLHNTTDPQANYKQAAAVAGIWNLVIYVNMAIPVAAFRESFNHLPTREADGTWVWSYTVTASNVVYVATLKGKAVASNVEWSMFLTREGEGGFTDFNWYTGTSALDRSQGSWSLNRSPDNPTAFVDISWHHDAAAGTYDIRFTNVMPDHAGKDGYIEHTVTGATPYDARYYVNNTENGNTVNIEWNRTTKEGRVSDPLHYGDTSNDWHYWDTSKNDMAAPAP